MLDSINELLHRMERFTVDEFGDDPTPEDVVRMLNIIRESKQQELNMERPHKMISELNGTLQRPLVEYIAYLEGWISATKDAMQKMVAPPRAPGMKKFGAAKSRFTKLCASCQFSRKVEAPEKSDIKFLILCDEPTYGKGENLVQQARQLGPCGPEAKLREEKTSAKADN